MKKPPLKKTTTTTTLITQHIHESHKFQQINNDDNLRRTDWEERKKKHKRESKANSSDKNTEQTLHEIEPFFVVVVVGLVQLVSMFRYLSSRFASLKYYKIIRTVRAISISAPMWHVSHMSGLCSSLTSFIWRSFHTWLSSKPFRLFLDKSKSCEQKWFLRFIRNEIHTKNMSQK